MYNNGFPNEKIDFRKRKITAFRYSVMHEIQFGAFDWLVNFKITCWGFMTLRFFVSWFLLSWFLASYPYTHQVMLIL